MKLAGSFALTCLAYAYAGDGHGLVACALVLCAVVLFLAHVRHEDR